MRKLVTLISLSVLLTLPLSGCASFGRGLKEFLGGKPAQKRRIASKKSAGRINKSRKYKRTDHETLQQRSKLGPNSGSLWIERGQGSYLFAQNTHRLIGDMVNIEIEGQAKKQIETKVGVIQDLLDRIKAQAEARRLAAAKRKGGKEGKAAEQQKAPAAAPKKGGSKAKVDIKIVPSRITEITKDGSYMVEGDQPFMIGKREYKLVVKGIVRQEEFDDQGISAESLLDPKFDIVTNKKKR